MMADAANVAGTLAKKKTKTKSARGFRYFIKKSMEQKELLLMSVPFLIWLFIFKYLPLSGWLMAFQDYKQLEVFKNQNLSDLINLSFYSKMIVS